MNTRRSCELCKEEASLYCDADLAFLCWNCDRRVHGANFLVARHVRRVTCGTCHSVDAASPCVSGAGSPPIRSICHSCDPTGPAPSTSLLSSSSCISTADSASSPPPTENKSSAARRRMAAERVLAHWSRRLGLRSGRRCVDVAAHVMGACSSLMTVMPYRVAMAAALWFAIKICEAEGGCTSERVLRRLVACSGVPAKLVMVAESRLARVVKRMVRLVEEGWTKCS